MLPQIRFLEPLYLWLLGGPTILLVVWVWQLARRRTAARLLRAARTLPVREHYPYAGGLSFWLCLLLAVTFVTLALARPQALVTRVQRSSVDFVVLQDGSTSMRVTDVVPDRWQRSTAWLRTFAEVLSWTDERVALALFAYRPAPQIRLTRDPNAFFFFLDHLGDEPPFRLEDDTSWDTNIEDGIAWGVKMIEKDAELYGRRQSAKAFIVISDGQAWSGEVSTALELARSREIRVYVVGVGTTAGGIIPDVAPGRYERRPPPIHSVLDRRSLRAIAEAGGGQYYELGAEPDQVLALRILSDAQRFAEQTQRDEVFADLYWALLVIAAGWVAIGTMLLKERVQLVWQVVTAGGLVLMLALVV